MLRNLIKLLLIVHLVGLLGCMPQSNGPSLDEKVVDELVGDYFNTFVAGDIDKLLSYYSEEFLRMSPKETWQARLQEIFTKYGKATKFSIAGKQVDTRYSGKFYIYRYDTWHTNNKRIKHIITYRRPVDNDSKILLVGHKITD